MAVLYLPDGITRIYRPNGEPLEGRNETPTTLKKKITAEGTTSWTRRNANNQIENYDATGKLTRITAQDGKFANLIYNESGKLRRVTDRSGRSLNFEYDEHGFLSRLTQPNGGYISYSYAGEKLIKVTREDGTKITYNYDSVKIFYLM